MRNEIRLSLAYRDMWQSNGKFFPDADHLEKAAHAIIAMGCFDRVETNGGAFEELTLLSGRNPNKVIRRWTAPFKKAGIQTQMLERGLCALRMNPVPEDVRGLMFNVKRAQGIDISRSFCGLNDPRNLQLSIDCAREAGMISQVALAIAQSPVHTLDYYIGIVHQVVEYGCDEICVKDMSGTADPLFISALINLIKKNYPYINIQFHGHCCNDQSTVSIIEAARAGADYIDVAAEPLAWGYSHPEVEAVKVLLQRDGFLVKDIDSEAYSELKSLIAEHRFISHANSHNNGILPGGMMGSLLEDIQDKDLLSRIFDEVEYIWPLLGYPPLVTPFSQYVKNTALNNIIAQNKGKERWSTIDKDSWNMILGKMGRLPAEPAQKIIDLANSYNLDFYTADPQNLIPNALDTYRDIMKKEGWDCGQDEEELLELAMHERAYRQYKRGVREGEICAAIALALKNRI